MQLKATEVTGVFPEGAMAAGQMQPINLTCLEPHPLQDPGQLQPLRGRHQFGAHGDVPQLGPGPVGEVEEGGHDLRRDLADLDDVVVVVRLEEARLDGENDAVHVELALAAAGGGAALYDLQNGRSFI